MLFSKHIPSDLFLCSYFLSGDQGLMFINCIQYSLRLLTYFQPWNVNQHVSVTQQLVDHGIRWLHLHFGCTTQPRLWMKEGGKGGELLGSHGGVVWSILSLLGGVISHLYLGYSMNMYEWYSRVCFDLLTKCLLWGWIPIPRCSSPIASWGRGHNPRDVVRCLF